MKINIFPFEEIESKKTQLRDKLKIPANVRLELAFDGVHGLNEMVRSLADLYPHKRSMAILGAQPSPVKEIISGLAGQGFHILELPVSLIEPSDTKLQTAWEGLRKDTLFVLTAATEPLTGALYPYEWIRAQGPKKSIFSLVYFSPDALAQGIPLPTSPYEGFVLDPLWGETFGLAAVLKGERCQGEAVLWGQPHFSDEAISAFENALQNKTINNSKDDALVIKKFEAETSAHLKSTFGLHPLCPRIFDRAVLFIDGAHGDSLVHVLNKKGHATYTGAACAWKNPHLNSWLPKMGIKQELVESSLIIPLETLKKKDFEKHLIDSVATLRELSGF